ncbi:MAG: aminoglycoside phosphotransferase family protein [Chloroflexi bacterium]|nr:aminoglycoside phosphotransferase family protein [Chloroflexota bacterium]
MTLPRPLADWVAAETGAALRSARQLAGSTSTTLYVLELDRREPLVLRVFDNAAWLAHEPDLPQHEVAALRHAARAGIPTPEAVALAVDDPPGGVPLLLMTALPGRVDLAPPHLAAWLDRLAMTLVPLHALAPDGFPWTYFTYNDVTQLTVPAWSAQPGAWTRVLDAASGPRPRARTCFIHRDYHPTNVLWQAGEVSGVVDWVNACVGAPNLDVAHCRLNLAQLYGVESADHFLRGYQAQAAGFAYDPYWDALALIEVLPGPPELYQGWVDFGVTHLTPDTVRARLDAYACHLAARL